jgi:hypothetical protein
MRTVLSALGVAFTTYLAAAAPLDHTARAADRPDRVGGAVPRDDLAVHLLECPHRRGGRSRPRAWANGRCCPGGRPCSRDAAAIVPNASWLAAGPDARFAGYATWSLGAVGALMTIVMVRRRPWSRGAGVALAGVNRPSGSAFRRPGARLVGAVLWVGWRSC